MATISTHSVRRLASYLPSEITGYSSINIFINPLMTHLHYPVSSTATAFQQAGYSRLAGITGLAHIFRLFATGAGLGINNRKRFAVIVCASLGTPDGINTCTERGVCQFK